MQQVLGSNPSWSTLHKLIQRLLYVSQSGKPVSVSQPRTDAAYKGEARNMTEWQNEETEGIKELRKKFKEQSKLIKELQQERETFQQTNRGAVVSQALASRGLDSRVSKFYPADLGTDDESVDRWVDENKDLFGVGRSAATNSGERETTLSEEAQKGYEIMQAMSAYDTSVQQDFESIINKIQYDPANPQKATDELLAALQAQGVKLSSM
jgi:hypothetical protein